MIDIGRWTWLLGSSLQTAEQQLGSSTEIALIVEDNPCTALHVAQETCAPSVACLGVLATVFKASNFAEGKSSSANASFDTVVMLFVIPSSLCIQERQVKLLGKRSHKWSAVNAVHVLCYDLQTFL
mmetsp:Transcript_467/g.1261  ORF Transcript_467/g.1261 Transcript_467/m.1261 type:complete len:126 (+) Transcript_467:2303-2680(+)